MFLSFYLGRYVVVASYANPLHGMILCRARVRRVVAPLTKNGTKTRSQGLVVMFLRQATLSLVLLQTLPIPHQLQQLLPPRGLLSLLWRLQQDFLSPSPSSYSQ